RTASWTVTSRGPVPTNRICLPTCLDGSAPPLAGHNLMSKRLSECSRMSVWRKRSPHSRKRLLGPETRRCACSPNHRNQSFHVVAILVVLRSEMIHHEGFFKSGFISPGHGHHGCCDERAQMAKVKAAAH